MSTTTDPMTGKLDQINEQITDLRGKAAEKWTAFEQARDEFASAGNESNRSDSDEFKKAEQVHREYGLISAELKEAEQVRDGVFRMAANNGHTPGQQADASLPSEKGKALIVPGQEPVERKSLGERAAESTGYKQLVESGVLETDRANFQAKLAEMSAAEFKTVLTGLSDTSAGAFITNDRKPYVQQPQQPPAVVDLITIGSTGVDVVEYARQTTFTNVAVEVAEATSSTTGTKPEATIAFEKVTETVRNIAHWIPATRRALADVPQMQTIVDNILRYGLRLRLELQLISGGGTGEDLKGIINQSNILTQAQGVLSTADAIHKAITQIRLGFLEPNGVGMHPTDYELLRLSRDGSGSIAGTGAYLYGPPSQADLPRVWGLPIASSVAFPDDTAIVGDFTQAVMWVRDGVTVMATDSHSDFFIKNLIVVLAEMRVAFGLLLPQAFCKVTGVD